MAGRVVIKLGGGLITDKSELRTPNLAVIHQLMEELVEIQQSGFEIILVHGAGSFGHLLAKEYNLAEGRNTEFDQPSQSQFDAVEQVRADMMTLNGCVMKAMSKVDLTAASFPPHQWVRGTGLDFIGDLSVFRDTPRGIIPMTFGDVVPCDDDSLFGILSGDDLVARLAIELDSVTHAIFAIGDVDGVLKQPPASNQPNEVIPILTEHDLFTEKHHSDIDVTGGIGLKVSRGFSIAKSGKFVAIVNGSIRGRILKALNSENFIGSRLVHQSRENSS